MTNLLAFFCFVALLGGHTLCTRVRCDSGSDDHKVWCGWNFPDCLEYEYVPDLENPGRFIFKCITCNDGWVPHWTHNNVETTTPGSPVSWLSMCAPNSDGKPVTCMSMSCFTSTFFFCQRFSVQNLTIGRPGQYEGKFKCLECLDIFEPVKESLNITVSSVYSSKPQLNVCTRRAGIFECGVACQIEFPGCSRYQVSKVLGGQGSRTKEKIGRASC